MDEKAFDRALRRGGLTADDILRRPRADRIDEVMTIFKRHRPADEVRRALYERIAKAPLAEFDFAQGRVF